MRAIAQQYINIASAAEFAHERELLPQAELDELRRDLQATIDAYPGLHESLVGAYEELNDGGSYYVLEPIGRLAAEQD
jgi:hypothetical protein